MFGNYEASFAGIPLDDDGLRTDLLEDVLKAGPRGRKNGSAGGALKLCYVVPNFQNSSGVTLSEERRRHLVDISPMNMGLQ